MKSYRQELWFETGTRVAFVNITGEVERCLGESGVREGMCLVNAMHITASVFINDDAGQTKVLHCSIRLDPSPRRRARDSGELLHAHRVEFIS